MKKTLLFILLAVFLSACGLQKAETSAVETETDTNKDEKPPELIVSSNGMEVAAILGTYSWSYHNEDGTYTSIEADSFGPPKIVKRQSNILKTKLGSEVVLDFAEPPTEISVRIWDNKQAVRDVEVNGATFKTDEKGKILYEVYAKWEQGSGLYAVKIDVQ